MWCNYCKRPTQIRRGYNMGIMIALVVLFLIPAIIYYFMCTQQCQVCKGTDIAGSPPADWGGGGPVQ